MANHTNLRCLAATVLLVLAPACHAVSLRFIIPSGATTESSRLYYQMIQQFEKQEPGIRIEFEPTRSWDAVIDRVLSPGQARPGAGLFVAEVSQTLELEQLGAILPMEELLERNGQRMKDFLAPIPRQFLSSGYCVSKKLCGTPFFRSMPVALYNLDQIKAAGWDERNLPETWSELEALLEQLHAKSGRAPFFLGGDWYDWLFEATVIQAGGSLMDLRSNKVTLNTPAAVKALEFWKRLREKGLLDRAPEWKDTLTGFTSGRYPVVYYSSGGMETVRANNRFAWMADMMPRGTGHGAALGGGNLYAMADLGKEQQAAAVKFVQFLYRPDIQAQISAATGYFPAVEAAFDEPLLKERYTREEPFMRARGQIRFARPKLAALHNLTVRGIVRSAIDRSLEGGIDPQTALRTAQNEVDTLLAQ